jgi:PAS domain S-box-containing protein
MNFLPIRNLPGKWQAGAFLLLAAGVGALWYSAISSYEAAVLRERGRELQAIAELKIDFIRLWLEERRGDAAVLAGQQLVASALAPHAGRAGAYGAEDVTNQLEAIRKAYHYKAVTLLDRAGNRRAGAGTLSDFGRRSTTDAALSAMAGGQVVVARSYHPEPGGRHHVDIDVAAPVAESRRPGAPVVGALAFHLDSRTHLDPLLRRWPASSTSGETFLFEGAGVDLIYLTTLRHAEAETLRRRADESALPAAMAASGGQGIVEGIDYRGVAVLAAIGQVPDMPWYVVAKVDRAEVLAPVRREALWSGALSALLTLALGLAMYSARRRSLSELALAQQAASKEALRASERRFRKLIENAWDFHVLFERDMNIAYTSPSVAQQFGRDPLGENIASGTARVHPDDIALVEDARREALARPGVARHFTHRLDSREGHWLTVEASFTSFFDDPDIGALSYVARDVSARIEAEHLLRESEDRYRFLFELSPDPVFVHRDNLILFANDAAARLFGAGSAQALVGRDVRALISPQDRPIVEKRIASLLSGEARFLAPLDQRYLALDGSPLLVEATGARIVIGDKPAIMSVIRDNSQRRQAEEQRMAYAREQRDTLVREVHHRIKNHLQGLMGLLRRQSEQQPGLALPLREISAQIDAIAVVHGLQGKLPSGEVRLSDLKRDVAAFLSGLNRVALETVDEPKCRDCSWRVAEGEAVPLALILNEVITNAIRHDSSGKAGQPPQAHLKCACNAQRAVLSVANPGALPAGFDFAGGKGLGTGLSLIRSLLPPQGATCTLAASDGWVEARIELRPPVLSAQAEPTA